MVGASGPAGAVREAVEPVVLASGLVLEGVQVKAAGRRSVVRVVVDLADGVGGIDADTLGEVSREISAALDAKDPVRGAYTLEVSTPGTDRPLTEPRHFRRARTRLVNLTLRDGTTVHGRLQEADDDALVVETAVGSQRLALADVARGEVEVELARAGDGDAHDAHDELDEHEEEDA